MLHTQDQVVMHRLLNVYMDVRTKGNQPSAWLTGIFNASQATLLAEFFASDLLEKAPPTYRVPPTVMR